MQRSKNNQDTSTEDDGKICSAKYHYKDVIIKIVKSLQKDR